jgi:hypothetical protein
MSLPPLDQQQTLTEICDLFKKAERAIKEVEDIGGELVVPAVNQLRYTGNHLIRYLSDPLGSTAMDELGDAVKHCKRAAYDAYEAAILNQLMEYQKFKDDYRNTIIAPIIQDYPKIACAIEKARTLIRNNDQSKTRGEYYRVGREHLQTIADNVATLNASRDDLNKQITRDRHKILFQVIGAFGAIAAVGIFILQWKVF